jgi:hypothetical protein
MTQTHSYFFYNWSNTTRPTDPPCCNKTITDADKEAQEDEELQDELEDEESQEELGQDIVEVGFSEDEVIAEDDKGGPKGTKKIFVPSAEDIKQG